jgi:starch synthase
MQVILSHSGKQHSYYVAKALMQSGVLKNFYTSSYIGSPAIQNWAIKNNFNFLSRRFLPGLYAPAVQSNWKYEVKEMALRALRKSGAEISNTVYERDVRFDRDLSKKLPRLTYDIFWGFQGSSLNCLQQSNKLGKKTVCEMTIAHLPFAKRLLEEEAKLVPEWAETIDFTNFPSTYEERLINEPLEARHVIAISAFLKKTLENEGVPPEKIYVIPLGFDASEIEFTTETASIENRPLRILYAGRITQRKGMSYLLEAIRSFNAKDVELHIIGNVHGNSTAFKKLSKYYIYQPGVSQRELFKLYGQYDVLVFPSLLEGFPLVTVEAMGSGLPVITTAHTNAAEVLKDGINGCLVPIRDSHAIEQAITRIRNMDNAGFQAMRHAAREAALQYTWDTYQHRVKQFLNYLS